MATLAQLENQIQKLQHRADQLRERQCAEVVASIHALMQEHGLTVADLSDNHVGNAGVKRRGRPAGSKNAVNGSAKAAKSKLPPKYRDPVSGLTWSGHARPPAWIKEAPDRDVFLINGRGHGATKNGAGRGRSAAGKSVTKKAARPIVKRASRKSAAGAEA
jgi:DNA-binding protein H-NS